MRFSLVAAISIPILIGTLAGISGTFFALNQTLITIRNAEVNFLGDDITDDIKASFINLEQHILLNLERFAGNSHLQRAVQNNDKVNAQKLLTSMKENRFPIPPSHIVITRENNAVWLKTTDTFTRPFDSILQKLVENTSLTQPSIIVKTGLQSRRSHILIYTIEISKSTGFNPSGHVKVIFNIGPESKFLRHLQSLADVDCIMGMFEHQISAWTGSTFCDMHLGNQNAVLEHSNGGVRRLIDHTILAKNDSISPIYPNFSIAGVRKTDIQKNQESHRFWSMVYVLMAFVISGIIAMVIALLFIRASIKSLLSFIRRNQSDENEHILAFRISEFYEIGQTHLRSKDDLLRLNEKLHEKNKEQAELTYAISHDVKSPIITTQMLVSELENSYPDGMDAEGKEIFKDLKDTTARMMAVIDSILSYARSAGENLTLEKVDTNHVVTEILADLKGDILNTNAEVIVGDLPVLNANHMQIRMLLQNIIANALKFQRPKSKAVVHIYSKSEMTKTGKQHSIFIQDNGIGIPKEFQERVFGLFKRLHSYSEYQGSGLGLAICQRIIHNHKGKIHITSEEGKGTTFEVVFPG